jgi:hypothetical protein
MTRTSIRSRPFHVCPESAVSTRPNDDKESPPDVMQSSTDVEPRNRP